MKIVSFKMAKKLWWKKFNLPYDEIIGKYDSDGVYHSQLYYNFTETMDSEEIIAPTIEQVLEWLRVEKKLFIEISMAFNKYYFEIYCTDNYDETYGNQINRKSNEIDYDSYEQTVIAGIEYVLVNGLI